MKRSQRRWLALVSATLMGLVGCGDDSSATGAGGAGGQAPIGGGGAANTGGDSVGGDDAGGSGGTGGVPELHPVAGETCDVIAQDCVDPAAPKCQLDFSDPALLPSICAPSYGDALAGEACDRIDNTTGKDNCAAGLICNRVNLPYSQPAGICLTLCDELDACGDGWCMRLNSDKNAPFPADTRLVGHCVESCDDVWDTTTCQAQTKCLGSDDLSGARRYTCFPTPGKAVGATCANNSECAPALGCQPQTMTCRPYCDQDHACGLGTFCTSTSLGYCFPPPAAWTCDQALFHDGASCDCECGAPDPDCDDLALPVVGCTAPDTCNAGNCVPAAWTCPGNYYGTSDGCDCGCGLVDPDCADATVSSCQYCGDVGGCSQGSTCPGAIDPINNAVCQ
ncbi:MAG: hypothetical protein U0271_08250 [Polyangiaceae bacterium]